MNLNEEQEEKYDAFDEERFVQDETHSSNRSAFERDRARILHSSALRRLGAKTQVLGAGFDDFVRTRLTHSLEVAQVGRDIATGLKINANIVDAACLAHDLGHPPFGHNGETVLNEIAKDFGGFEGNAQTLRLLIRLEPKIIRDGVSAGLNLTRATLDATVKYPWGYDDKSEYAGEFTNKFGYYEDDLETYNWIRKCTPENKTHKKCVEAQIMDFSDDVSYSVHDTEDGIVSGFINMKMLNDKSCFDAVLSVAKSWYGAENNAITEIEKAKERFIKKGYLDLDFDGSFSSLSKLKNMTSSLIGRFANSALSETNKQFPNSGKRRYLSDLVVNDETVAEITLLKAFTAAFIMQPRNQMDDHTNEKEIIRELWKKFNSGKLYDSHFQIMFDCAKTDNEKKRIIIDQIASLTDVSALRIVNQF